MRLVHDWRALLRRAWSLRLLAVAMLLSGLEILFQMIGGGLPISRLAFAILFAVITAAAFAARLVAQTRMGVGAQLQAERLRIAAMLRAELRRPFLDQRDLRGMAEAIEIGEGAITGVQSDG